MSRGSNGDRSIGRRTQQLRSWYTENVDAFVGSPTIQPNRFFAKLTSVEQERLNRFKLWFLERPDLVDLRGKKILEFGCGHARMALETSGYESYIGVDFVEPFIKLGRQRLERAGVADRAELVYDDCLNFKGPLQAFDVVGALGMWEFVEFPEAMIRKMASHLKPGGKLFIDAHSSSFVYNVVRRRRHRKIEASGGVPKRLFSGREIRDLFKGAGLVNVKILMKEWPFLGGLYARRGWDFVLKFRNRIAPLTWLHPLGTDFVAIGEMPE